MTILLRLIGFLSGVSNDQMRTVAAFVQASGFFFAAYLTFNYAKRLEGHKFEMKLKEIAHANTHKRRMQCIEDICGLMGKVISKLGMVPDFFDYFELDPIPPQEMENTSSANREESRSKFRLRQYHLARLELMEATEVGYIYLDEANLLLIGGFINEVELLILKFDEDRFQNHPMAKLDAMGKFKEGYNKVKETRTEIVDQFRKQLCGF